MSRAGKVAIGLVSVAALLAALIGITWSDAGFLAHESARLGATAGVVPPAVTTCTPGVGGPHIVTLAPTAEGLPVTGYRVTQELDADLPADWTWAVGEAEGVPMTPWGDSFWPADQATVGFGIELPFLAGGSASGTTTIRAVGPGGWESAATTYDWSISASWGVVTSTCEAPVG